MSTQPIHHCPGCGTAQASNPRYPWYCCQGCIDRATDGAGRGLKFTNTGLGGGFAFRYSDTAENEDGWFVCSHAICLINARPVLVGEARFGGIVAEPLDTRPRGRKHRNTIDLKGQNRYEPDTSKGRHL